MQVCLRRKRTKQGLLFKGSSARRITSPHMKACFVGAIFEELTAVLLSGTRGTTDGSYDCCPDVCLPQKYTVVESKASCRTCFVVHVDQMDRYRSLHEEHLTTVLFALWRYAPPAVPARPARRNGVLYSDDYTRSVVAGVRDVWVIGFELMDRLISAGAPRMYYIRQGEGRVGYYRVGAKCLRPLWDDPLGYAGRGYVLHQGERALSAVVDGVQYTTQPFKEVQVVDAIPF